MENDQEQTYEGMPRDFQDYVVPHPETTFFLQATNEGLPYAGILHGDVLVVDLSLTPRAGDVVVVVEQEAFRIQEWSQGLSNQMEVWGVVTYVLHARRPRER